MKTNMLKTARRLWCAESATRDLQRRNIRAWVCSVRQLGDRWVLVGHEQKLETPIPEGKMSSMVLPFPVRTPRSMHEAFKRREMV